MIIAQKEKKGRNRMSKRYKRVVALLLAAALAMPAGAPVTARAEEVQETVTDVQEVAEDETGAGDQQESGSAESAGSNADNTEETQESADSDADKDTSDKKTSASKSTKETAALSEQEEDYPVKVGETGYASLEDAVSAAASGSVIMVLQDVEISKTLTINKSVTIAAPEDGTVTISRASSFTGGNLFNLTSGATFRIGDEEGKGTLIIDGGAVWVKDVEEEDPENPDEKVVKTVAAESAAEETAYNDGVKATAALLWLTNGTLYLSKNAVMQNNDQTKGGGGAIATSSGGSSKVHIYGTLKNNKVSNNGGAISSNGYVDVYEGAGFTGNRAENNAGALENYGGGIVTIRGGSFTGNRAKQNGGALYTDGKMEIQAGTIENNLSSEGKGGGLYVASSNDSRSALLYGGTIQNNTAVSGGDLYQGTQNAKYKGGAVIGELYLSSGQYLKVQGTLSGSIGVIYAQDPGKEGIPVAKGDGYTLKKEDADKISSASELYSTTYQDQTVLYIYRPVIIEVQPENISEVELDQEAQLKVEARSAAGTEISYQWYACSDASGSDAHKIEEETGDSYTVPTAKAGIYYYYCELMAEQASSSRTEVVSVKVVDKNTAEIPRIVSQPEDGTYDLQKEITLQVEAAVEDEGELSYQWYGAEAADAEGEPVDGATEAAYTFMASESGTFYYYCIVTNTKTGLQNPMSKKQTRSAVITINAAAAVYNGIEYSTLDDALANVDGAQNGTLKILADGNMNRTITIDGGNLLIVSENETAPVMKASVSLVSEAFIVKSGTLTLQNVQVDGGAIWTGTTHDVLQRGTSNRGRSVEKPLITMNGGTVNLEQGSALQNNVVNWAPAGINMTSGTLNINGGRISDCYGGSHGGAVYSSSSNCEINMTDGQIIRNQARSSTGGLCADTGTRLTLSGGEIANNYTVGRAGGVFINGTMSLSGDVSIHDNYAGSNGGGILHYTGTLQMSGGSISNNKASSNGGGIASLGGTLNLTGGTVEGNVAVSYGNGLYLESGVQVTADRVPAGITDTVFSMKTYTLTLDGNGLPTTAQQTIRYLSIYELPQPERNGYQFLGWFTEAEEGTQVKSGDRITVKSNTTLYAHWMLTATNVITVNQQPGGGRFYVEDKPVLKVDASAASGNLIYQWYRCEDEEGSNPTTVGENSPEFSLLNDTEQLGTYYYYCQIIAEDRDAADVNTDVVKVTLISKNVAYTPVFSAEPADQELFTGQEAVLEAQAEVIDGGTVTYQWYQGESSDPEKAVQIPGAEGSSYTINPQTAGTVYYFVKAVNSKKNEKDETVTAETWSRAVKVVSHEKITVEVLNSGDKKLTQNYWKTYRVGIEEDNYDGYISSYISKYGSYSNASMPQYAFDGNFNTFWETRQGVAGNQMEMHFSKEVKLDRIIYSTRQDGYKGRGYPTVLTIYSKNGEGEYTEVGVAKSDKSNGYVMFTLPETLTSTDLIFEFTSAYDGNWASASELILLRDEDKVLTGSAVVSGNAVPGGQLTVESMVTNGPQTGLNILDLGLSCQWQESEDGTDYQDISGETSYTYTVQEDSKPYVRAVLRDSTGVYAGAIVSTPYRTCFTVSVDGKPSVGSQLSARMGYMSENAQYQYRWERKTEDGEYEAISGADQSAYEIRPQDVGYTLRLGVKASIDSGSSYSQTVYSAEIPVSVSAILTGAPQVGSTLKASLSGVDKSKEIAMTYEWQRSVTGEEGTFTAIDGETNASWTIPEALLNEYVRAVITLTEAGESFTSEAWKILPAGTIFDCEGDMVYLSDLPKEDLKQGTVGYGNLQFDKNTSGNMISLLVEGEKNYFMKGLGAHAPATLVYDISNYVNYYHYDRFIAYLGLDSAQGSNGNGVKFTISTSQNGTSWIDIKTTGVLTGVTNCVSVDLDLEDAKYLKIYIDANGNSASDHSVVADAKLASQDYVQKMTETDLFKTPDEYDEELKEYAESHSDKTAEELLQDEEYRKLLYQRTFVKAVGYNLLKAYLYDEEGTALLEWFLNDMEALDLYMGGGNPDGSYANFVAVLKRLYSAHSEDLTGANGSLYKKMMITLALTHSASVTYWVDSSVKSDAVRRYEIYKKLYEEGLLLNNVYKNLTVEEMRWVLNNISADEEIEWLNYYVRTHKNKNLKPEDYNLSNFTPGPYSFITYTMGFNYYQSRFYSEENRNAWQTKYSLTNETADPKDERYDFNITYENNHPRLWIVWEAGAVCGGISKTGSNLLTAFGVPGVVIGQPGHAAYFQYSETADGQGKWDIYNDISGWTLSEKGERMLNSWGSASWCSGYNGSYLLLAQAALNDAENYYTSQELVKLADVYSGDPEKQIEIYEEALKVQDININAWTGLISAYKAAGKSESDYLQLSSRVAEALTYYPLPNRDIQQNLIRPIVASEVGRAELTIYLQTALTKAKSATANDTLQPNPCKTMANYLLGNNNYSVATFSFDGAKAGKIVLNDSFSGGNEVLYSLNGGQCWKVAGVGKEFQLSEDEIEQITAENDILVRLQGTTAYHTIDITEGTNPSGIYNNDKENRITGDISKLQWKDAGDEGGTWQDITSDTTFEGDRNILVRTRAIGTAKASAGTVYKFTADTDKADRKYIPLSQISLTDYSSAQDDKSGAAAHILDGNINTIWHTLWDQSDSKRYITVEFSEPRYLTSVDYTPNQQGNGNGRFQTCEIYTSMDGQTWTLAGTASGWANNTAVKTVNLFAPVYTKYAKVVAPKAVNNYASGAMLEFYEDTTVKDKTVTSLELHAAPNKTSYVRGEELDIAGLNVTAYYDDGSYSTMNNELLSFDNMVFRETGNITITGKYWLDEAVEPIRFQVTVSENTRTAESIAVTELPDKIRYFEGDTLDITGLTVKAVYTDGTSGYIFDDQYTISPTTLSEAGKEIPVTVTYTQNGSALTAQFMVEVTKSVEKLAVTKAPEQYNYNLGEAFNSAGMEVSLMYKDGSSEVLDSTEYSIQDNGFSHTSGTKKITVIYNRLPEKTAETEVLVYPYITDEYLQLESEEGKTNAYVSGITTGQIPENGIVTVPDQVTAGKDLVFDVTGIGAGAFADQKTVTAVKLPSTVNNIESGAFTGCTELKEIYLTGHTSFDDLAVADDAFGDVEGNGTISGVIYVADQAAAEALAARNLAAFQNFTIIPITDKISGVTVTPPEKTEYRLGEFLDLTGMKVQGILEDGQKLTLSENLYEVSAFDGSKAGEQTITVTCKGTGYTAGFQVQVTPDTPVIEQQPKSANYDISEFPEPLTVKASVEDAGTLTYQWYAGDTEETAEPIPSENGMSCPVTPGETKYYYVVVTSNDSQGSTEVKARSETAKVTYGSYEARVEDDAYATLSEAIEAAEAGAKVRLIKDITVQEKIAINKNLTISGSSITRDESYTDGPVLEISGGKVVLSDLTLDGGAVWNVNFDSYLNRATNNIGVKAMETLVLVSGGELNLSTGAVLQNNCNSADYGKSGGAVRISSGTVRIIGGNILDNYSTYGGAILAQNTSSVTMESGRIAGNQSGKSGGAFCIDHTSAFKMQDSKNVNILSVLENNKGNESGGAIWMSNGSVTLEGGIIRNNYGGNGGVLYMNGSGTASLGAATLIGNSAKTGNGIYANNGTLQITGVPDMTDTIYLPNGKLINIKADLSSVTQPIPVAVASYNSAGEQIGTAASNDLVRAAAGAFAVTGGNLPVYAYGTGLYYGNPTTVTITKDLPASVSIMAGRQLNLSVEAEVESSGDATPVYKWYRCSDAEGNGATLITTSQSSEGNVLSLGDCEEGVCYFYCEVTASNDKADTVRSQICTVTVTKFIPGSKAIEKFSSLP